MTTVSGKEFQILIIRTEKKLDLKLWHGVQFNGVTSSIIW